MGNWRGRLGKLVVILEVNGIFSGRKGKKVLLNYFVWFSFIKNFAFDKFNFLNERIILNVVKFAKPTIYHTSSFDCHKIKAT